jgi:hypothetical protein
MDLDWVRKPLYNYYSHTQQCCYIFAYYYGAGFNVLFSGAAAEFNISNEAYDVLIPAVVETLMTLQQPYRPLSTRPRGLCGIVYH